MEKASEFENNLKWSSEVAHDLIIEELIGALVSAEQELYGLMEKSGE